jgi:hypothetical protein
VFDKNLEGFKPVPEADAMTLNQAETAGQALICFCFLLGAYVMI